MSKDFIGSWQVRFFLIVVTILLPSILSAMECEEEGGFFGMYKPPFVPVEITIDRNRIEVETTAEVLTPYGTFGLGYSKDFSSMDNDCYYVVINNTSTKEKIVYAINKGERLNYDSKTLRGIRHFVATTNMMEFDVDKNDRFIIRIDEDKIEKFAITYEDGNLNIGKGDDIVSIPVDDIAKVTGSIAVAKLVPTPLVAGYMLYKSLSSDESKVKENINKVQVQLLASKNESKVIQEIKRIKSQGVDNVYYLEMKNGYYKVLVDSDDKDKLRRLLPEYSDSFLVRIEN